jgi:hypothetical protein
MGWVPAVVRGPNRSEGLAGRRDCGRGSWVGNGLIPLPAIARVGSEEGKIMAIHKRKRRGKIDWYYKFDLPGATRESRRIIRHFGFATRQEAVHGESSRRLAEQQKCELAKADREVPKTLAMLLDEFFSHHACENLAPKTVERYRDTVANISKELLGKPLAEITALHLNREWSRLLKAGGHLRNSSAKSVRNIAGVISGAFSRAIKWGLTTTNPVTNSEPPKVKKHHGIAFTPAVQRMVIDAAVSPWCVRTYLEMVAATQAVAGIQMHQDRGAAPGESASFSDRGAGRTPQSPGRVSSPVRARVSKRPRLDFRES